MCSNEIVLLTRAESASLQFSMSLSEAFDKNAINIPIVIAPMFRVEYRDFQWPNMHEASVVVTSQNGARALEKSDKLPEKAYVVGKKSADLLEDKNIKVMCVAKDVSALIEYIKAKISEELIWITGSRFREDLQRKLDNRITKIIAYDIVEQAADLSGLIKFQKILLPLFSLETARNVLGQLKHMEEKIEIVPISQNLEKALKIEFPEIICHKSSRHPSGEMLIDKIVKLKGPNY